MDKPIVLGVGEFLWDCLPDGKKAGGAPVNFAYHASQNGTEAWAVSAVGKDDLGAELLEVAKAHGINLLVETVDKPTGTVQVTLDSSGTPNFEICEDVAWDYIPVTDKSLEMARRAGAISYGTLAQRSKVSRDTTRALIKATPADALRVYDINLRQHFYSKELIESTLELSNVFKINDDELAILKPMFGMENMNDDDACFAFISKYGLKMLVLTGGAVFSSIYSADGSISTMPTPKVKVVDSVGAGDSFSGALVGSLLSGKSISEAHKAAVGTAAYVCTKSGAWTPPESQ